MYDRNFKKIKTLPKINTSICQTLTRENPGYSIRANNGEDDGSVGSVGADGEQAQALVHGHTAGPLHLPTTGQRTGCILSLKSS